MMQEYFMPIYTTLVGTVIGLLVGWIRTLLKGKQHKKDIENGLIDALKDGMAILLRKQLFEYYETYEYQESIPIAEWKEIEETHKVYNRLGGNHSGDRIFEEMKSKHLEANGV